MVMITFFLTLHSFYSNNNINKNTKKIKSIAKCPVSEQLAQSTFCEGLIDFVDRFADEKERSQDGIDVVHLKV